MLGNGLSAKYRQSDRYPVTISERSLPCWVRPSTVPAHSEHIEYQLWQPHQGFCRCLRQKAPKVQSEQSNEGYSQPMYRTQMAMKTDAAGGEAMPDIDFKKIKLSAQIRAVFELK